MGETKNQGELKKGGLTVKKKGFPKPSAPPLNPVWGPELTQYPIEKESPGLKPPKPSLEAGYPRRTLPIYQKS